MARRKRRPTTLGRGPKLLLACGALLLFATGIYFGIQLGKPPPLPDVQRDLARQGASPPAAAAESDAREDTGPAKASAAVSGAPVRASRVAVVIDDLGRNLADLERLADLRVPVTYAVLPFEPRSQEIALALGRRGAEVVCPIPMEAQGPADPGPGTLTLTMGKRELARATRRALEAVPGAVGVSNHMGSGLTRSEASMRAVLTVVADAGLYYLDSRTTSATVALATARQLGVPAVERQVFLDNSRDRTSIRREFDRLVSIAVTRGSAIGIGHPYPETLEVLAEKIPAAKVEGVEFVSVSTLLTTK